MKLMIALLLIACLAGICQGLVAGPDHLKDV